jgi:hypothetical protein
MAKGFKHGAGGANPLNFKVVGNPQPQNPKENTIWVDTDVDITTYHFSSEPISTNLDLSNFTNANDVASGFGDNGANFYGSLPIMWSKTYLFKIKLIAGVTYKLDSTGFGYGRIGAFRKPIRDDNNLIRIEGADPQALLDKNRRYSIFTPIETTDAYFYYCTDAYNTGSNPAFSVFFALYLVGNPIWITTGTSSHAAFNALKKNTLQVYPISAKQYIGVAWVDKTAKIYQDDEWTNWQNPMWIIQNGVELIEMNLQTATKTAMDGFLRISGNSDGYHGAGAIVDVTNFKNLVLEGEIDTYVGYLCMWDIGTTNFTFNNAVTYIKSDDTRGGILPIETYSGKYRVGVAIIGGRSHKIANLYLE